MDDNDRAICDKADQGFNGLGRVVEAVFLVQDTILQLDQANQRQQEEMVELMQRMTTLTRIMTG